MEAESTPAPTNDGACEGAALDAIEGRDAGLLYLDEARTLPREDEASLGAPWRHLSLVDRRRIAGRDMLIACCARQALFK